MAKHVSFSSSIIIAPCSYRISCKGNCRCSKFGILHNLCHVMFMWRHGMDSFVIYIFTGVLCVPHYHTTSVPAVAWAGYASYFRVHFGPRRNQELVGVSAGGVTSRPFPEPWEGRTWRLGWRWLRSSSKTEKHKTTKIWFSFLCELFGQVFTRLSLNVVTVWTVSGLKHSMLRPWD